MINFNQLIPQMDSKLFNVFGVLCEYKINSTGEIKSKFKIILDENIEVISDGGYGEISKKMDVVYIRRSDIDNPNYKDQITIGESGYQVEEEINRDNFMSTVTVKRIL